MRCAFDRAFVAQGAGLAAFFAVEDVAPGNAVMARLHQFGFHQILDELDFERVAFHRMRDGGMDHRVGNSNDVALRRGG